MKLGNKLRELRKAKGHTQHTLAESSGVAYSSIQEIEWGKGNPTIDTLEALASTLGVGIFDLFPANAEKPKAVAEMTPDEFFQRLEKILRSVKGPKPFDPNPPPRGNSKVP